MFVVSCDHSDNIKMAAFGDAKMDDFMDRPWKSVTENLSEDDSQKITGAIPEESATCQESSSMKLKKEDMMLYGLCPAQDEFFLAICERCKLLVKPQALKTHIAIRHSQVENHSCKTSLSKANDQLLKYNSQVQPETFKNPKDYIGSKSQQVISRSRTSKKCVGRRSNVIGKDCNVSKNHLGKNLENSLLSANNCVTKSSDETDGLLPTLIKQVGGEDSEALRLTNSILKDKPYVDIARMDSEIMSLMSAMDESFDGLMSDGNDQSPPKLKPETLQNSEDFPCSESPKISVFNHKVLPRPQVSLVDALTKKIQPPSPASFLTSKNGKVSIGTEIPQYSDQSSEIRVMPQPVIQLNVQNLRPLLNKSVIGHPSILTIKKTNLTANQLKPILKQASSTSPSPSIIPLSPKPPSLIHASSLLVQKSPSSSTSMNSPKITLISPMQLTLSTKSSPGKSIKKKAGNPDHALCKNRQYDPDKHCGVLIAETQKPCTRFLTCKTHPLLLRRAVPGRSKTFDELVKELREKRQATVRGISQAKEREIPAGASLLKIVNVSKADNIGCDKSNQPKNLHSTNGAVAITCSSNLPPRKPNHLLLTATAGEVDSLLKHFPDQSPSEDVFSGLLSPSGMLLSPCVTNIGLFSPGPSGSNLENFTMLKTELMEELDFGFQTPNSSMPSLAPFDVKVEDLCWQAEVKESPRVLSSSLGMGASNEGGIGNHMECKNEDEEEEDEYDNGSFSLKNGLEVFDHHPRPIAVNHFNSWLYGSGNYVFTRRGNVCRTALMSAIEPEICISEPPKKRIRLDPLTSKLPSSTNCLVSSNISHMTESQISQHQPSLHQRHSLISSKITNTKTPPLSSGFNGTHHSPCLSSTEMSPQFKKRPANSVPSFQCSSLPPNVTLTRSSVIPTSRTSASSGLLSPSKKQISLTPLNISQISVSLKNCQTSTGSCSSTTAVSLVNAVSKGTVNHGGQLVHLTLPGSGCTSGSLTRTLFAITTTSPAMAAGTTSSVTISKNHAQSIAISKGATLLLQPSPSQLPVLSPSATVILAPSRGVSPNNLFALQNSPDTILQLLPRAAVQNGRATRKSMPVILTNRGKAGPVDLSSVVGLGLRPPNIFLSTSGASSSSSSSSSFPSTVGLNLSSVASKNSQIQNLILRLPNGVTESSRKLVTQDAIIRVPSTSAPSSVMVVTSLPDRPINSVLLINNKRLALNSTAANVIHPSHQSINLSSVLSNQRQPSSQSLFSSPSSSSNLLLWGLSNNNSGSSNIGTLHPHEQPQKLQRVQLISNQSAACLTDNNPSKHVKESSAAQLTRLSGITLSANPRNVHHILLGIPQKRSTPFQKGQLVIGDLEEFGNLQTEEEISQSAFPAPIA